VAQFDVYRLGDGMRVVDLRTALIDLDATRIPAPLRGEGTHAPLPGLTPSVEIEGRCWIVRLQELAAVPATELRVRVGSIAALRDALKRGLDILIDGF
jgi:toxin CcdB